MVGSAAIQVDTTRGEFVKLRIMRTPTIVVESVTAESRAAVADWARQSHTYNGNVVQHHHYGGGGTGVHRVVSTAEPGGQGWRGGATMWGNHIGQFHPVSRPTARGAPKVSPTDAGSLKNRP